MKKILSVGSVLFIALGILSPICRMQVFADDSLPPSATFTINEDSALTVQDIFRTAPPADCTTDNCDGWLYKDDNSDPNVWSQSPTSDNPAYHCFQILDDAYCNLQSDSDPYSVVSGFFEGASSNFVGVPVNMAHLCRRHLPLVRGCRKWL